MKTVLAPGAPWPKREEPVEPVKLTKPVAKPKPKKKPSKIARTDAKYIEWAGKNLGTAV